MSKKNKPSPKTQNDVVKLKAKPTAHSKKDVSAKRANALAASKRDPIDMASVGGAKLKGEKDLAKADISESKDDFGNESAVSGDINDQLKVHTRVLDGSMLDVHVSKPFRNVSNGETHWVRWLVETNPSRIHHFFDA